MILRHIWPIELALSGGSRPSKTIWQKPAHSGHCASTFTTTSFARRCSRNPPPIRNLETFNVSIRQSHTDSATPPRVLGAFTVSTFNSSALKPSDYLDISNRRGVIVRLSTQKKAGPGSPLFHDASKTKSTEGFPPNTKGFLYLHKPLPRTYPIQGSKGAPANEIIVPTHLVAGELRFRLLDTPDPAKFAEGRDFATEKVPYKPWAVPFINILQYSKYRQLSEALTSQAERDNIQAFFTRSRELAGRHHYTSFRHSTPVLDNILEPFVHDFSRPRLTMGFLDTDCIVTCNLTKLCVASATTPHYKRSPYSGSALCRFEPAIKQSRRHTKTGLTIRVLKWLEPPNPTDFVVQEEGGLLKKYHVSPKEEAPSFINTKVCYIPPASWELLSRAFPISNSFAIDKLGNYPRATAA